MNKQQTAVEWLENRIKFLIPKDIGSQLMYKINIAKTKFLEKQQIMEANNQGYEDGYKDNGNSPIDYFNKNFKN